MSLEPHQIALIILELALILGGVGLWLRAAVSADTRATFFHTHRLAHWNLAGAEVVVLACTMVLTGMLGATAMFRFAQPLVRDDAEGMMVIFNGVGFHGFALLGWPLFHLLRRSMAPDLVAATGGAPATTRRASWLEIVRAALVTLALALPVVGATGVLWTFVLQQFGIDPEPQDLIGIFGRVESASVLAGMLFVACVVAPMNEEVIFRGVFFRFLRQRFGRAPALLLPAAVFGALHGNLAGFLPLAILGVGFALAYEQTGDIRVPIVAHALFNLNTIVVLLAGLAAA